MTHAEIGTLFNRMIRDQLIDEQDTEAMLAHLETCEEEDCRDIRNRAERYERGRQKLLRDLWGEDSYGFQKQRLAMQLIKRLARK